MTYITEYNELHPKEQRQLSYKRRFKAEVPSWDDSMVLLKNELEKRILPNSSVLDAGCGHGNYLIDELREKFSSAVGVDVSEEVMNKNICLDKTIVANIENMPFENNSFDLVVALWVVEHLDHPKEVFQEISRVLKPGGYFAFATPNKKSILIYIRRLLNYKTAQRLVKKTYGRAEDDTFDVRYRANTVQKITELANQHGLTVEILKENMDPSYTSFNTITYQLSKWFSLLPFSFCKPHLAVILKKP